jgi:N-acetylglucosamine-6-phosphate deacetylase
VRLGVSEALVDGVTVPGDVEIEDGRVAQVGLAGAPAAGGTAVAGLVDAHINGVADVDFLRASEADYRRAAQALARQGVVAYQPTFVSSRPDAYREPAAVAGAVVAAKPAALPFPVGIHLEGPFLAREWAGAHDRDLLLCPDPALAEELLGLGPVTTMTLAPELPGGLELVELLHRRGIVVSIGHTDADAAVAHEAFDRGARAITHIYNAHRRWHHREPGPAGAALARPGVTVQAIVDGVHLAPGTAYGAFLAAGTRFAMVTDAVAGQGACRLGGREVRAADGAARLADGTLAGSVIAMDASLRLLVSSGASLAEAVHAASTAPAALLGRPDLGRLAPGTPAHVTVLDNALHVTRTLVGGREAFAQARG